MSMRSLESEILAEAKTVTGNKKLRLKDIMEWRTSSFEPEPGEVLHFLPTIGVYVAVKKLC